MKPSFLSSTLSLTFILCVIAVIVMIFMWLEMPEYGNETVVTIISAYLATRLPNTKTEQQHADKSIHDTNSIPNIW